MRLDAHQARQSTVAPSARRPVMEKVKKPNRLIHEKSPYLLQHAYNPVDWYPWGDEAFAAARREQKPIFLSVGYSTCHWCHVMEKESFEVDSIAQLMNRYFVCIKVDREERPDVDRIYMTALQAMGQNGGWPMSMFLTPDLRPFYGGTYFPPESRSGRAGFPDILRRIHEVWEHERSKVTESAGQISRFLEETPLAPAGEETPGSAVLDTAFEQFRASFDSEFGGFGDGPKFPRPSVFAFLLRYYARTGKNAALEMTERTLRAMSRGGIYDHVGGGFHRYSVDAEWRVPHFEKMLYDQAQLVVAYVDLYQITHIHEYASIVDEILGYVLRDMTSPGGGFYSAEDADSPAPGDGKETGEGAFYLWSKNDILRLLGDEAGGIFSYAYGVEDSGNAPFDPQEEFTGKNILYLAHPPGEVAAHFTMTEAEVKSSLERSRNILYSSRAKRPRPGLDDKILTSWNGLMISAFARAYQAFADPRYLQAARASASFVLTHIRPRGTKLLERRWKDDDARFEGQLVDFSFFVQGLLDLFEASADASYLQDAIDLTESQISLFWDDSQGGFFDTSGKDPSILVRMKEQYDSAEPAGNSVAAMNLLRLSQILDRDDWRGRAERIFRAFSRTLRTQPVVMPQLVAALDYFLATPKQIIIVGGETDPATRELRREVFDRYLPNKIVVILDDAGQKERLSRLIPYTESMSMADGKPTAYVCQHYACQLPTSDPARVRAMLAGK